MKWGWLVVLGVVLLAAPAGAGDTTVLKTMMDKVSYATGVEMARSFRRQGVEVDRELFLKGVKDGLSGDALLLSDDEYHKTLKVFHTQQKMKLAERKKQLAEQKRKQRENATLGTLGPPAPVATDNTQP